MKQYKEIRIQQIQRTHSPREKADLRLRSHYDLLFSLFVAALGVVVGGVEPHLCQRRHEWFYFYSLTMSDDDI